MYKYIFYVLALFLSFTTSAQEIEKKWQLSSSNKDYLELKGGSYELHISSDSLKQKGDYLVQDNFIFLFENGSDSPTKRFVIETKTDSTLTLKNRGKAYSFFASNKATKAEVINGEIKPNEGFSLNSLLRGILGMVALLGIAYIFSSNRKAINWKTIGIGLALQLILAVGVLKIGFVKATFEFVGTLFVKVLDFTRAGSEFLLGGMMNVDNFGFIFLFQVLPTIIFFSALTSLLFYLGVIQIVVKGMATVLTKLMNISGPEGLSTAGNIFLGQTEAPLMIKAYLEKMNQSEVFLVMTGGMATVAGGVLAAYISFLGGNDPALRLEFAKHLLAASVMAAPGAIIISKILCPQTEVVNTDIEVTKEKIGSNILDAIATGTTEGLKLAANVAAMLLVFIAFIAMINYTFGKIGLWTGLNDVIADKHTLQIILIRNYFRNHLFTLNVVNWNC